MPPATRGKQPPAIVTPDFSNLYKLNFEFNDEKIIKADPFVDAISNYFAEADELNKSIKALIAERTKKKVPATPKKKVAAMTLVRNQINELRKINFDDDDDESFEIPPIPSPPPRRHSPKKPVTSQKRNAGGDAYSSPIPGSSNSANTPVRGGLFSHSTFAPCGLGTSRINKPTIVPKAAIVKEKDPNLKDKLRLKAETAEERRKKQLHETQEKIRKENEEKEKKNRERKQQLEEETRRKHEATKLKEAKMREFEAIQREEARPVPSTTNTPKKDNKKNKEVLTPRQALVPAKKGKTLPAQKFDFEVVSPVRKHKKPTPPKAAPSKAATHQLKESVDLYASEEDEVENNQLADEEDNAQPLNYIEITPEKAEADIRSKSGGRALSSGDIPNVRRTSDGNETAKIARSSDIVADSFHSKANKFKSHGKIFADVIQDSVNESFAKNVSHTEQVVKAEPMEEDEYENDENAVPMQQDINKSSYDMTVDKVYLPSTETNYNVDDLSSNDETDDESKPRKTVPNWAKKHELNPHVKKMLRDHSTLERITYFGSIQPPSLKVLFNISDNRRHRNSSAVWQSPLHQPTAGLSRLPRR
jgi:hypothetical protein|uniref:Inner centromere protein ARK-binding domain-containing protein n=1 Tax=Panagrolaimus sp. PS1159 TaxID=55785 RepID=A0AC35FGB2_9BILA